MDEEHSGLFQNIGFYIIKGGMELLRLLPLKAAFGLATFLANMFYFILLPLKKRMITQILHAGITKSNKEASILARKNFIHMFKIGVEFMVFDKYITPQNLPDHIRVIYSTPEAEQIFKDLAVPIIYASAHYGNWEMSGNVAAVMHPKIISVMRAMPNKKLTDYLLSKRAIFKQELCFKKFSFNILLKSIREGKSVGIICDQHAGRLGIETEFFGHPAKTFSSSALLHLRTGAPILVGVTKRRDDNFNYDVYLEGPIMLEKSTGNIDEDARILTQMFTAAFERLIRNDPVQWTWTHRRWTDIYKKNKKRSSS